MAPPKQPAQELTSESLGVQRTQFATQALITSEVISGRLASKTYGMNPVRRLKVEEPDGPSTDGGRKARQSITLMAPGAASVVCGWMDVSLGEAQLRTHESVERRYRGRSSALDLSAGEYGRFLDDLGEALSETGFRVRYVIPEEGPSAPPPAPVGPAVLGVNPMLVVALAAASFMVGVLAGLLLPRFV